MNIFLRVMLFTLFAVAGVGIAIGVAEHVGLDEPGDSPGDDRSSDVQPGPLSSQYAAQSVGASQKQPGPVPAIAYPLVARQASDGGDSSPESMTKFITALGALINNKPSLAARQSPLPIPAVKAVGKAASANAAGTDSTGKPRSLQITRIGEGDNHLSITIKDDNIRDVLDYLGREANLNILASVNVKGNVSATLHDVDIFSAISAIVKNSGYSWRREGDFLYIGTPEDFKLSKRAADRIGTRLYRPNYISAKELEQLITPLLSTSGTVKATSPSQTGIGADSNASGGNDYSGAEAIVVRDYEAVLTLVDELVRDVDTRPLQVAIEAIILSVKIDDKNSMGVDFEILKNKNNVRLVSGTPLDNLASINLSDGGLKFGFLDSKLSAFIDALETIGDAEIIATPRLMCLNRQRAEILIGEQLGYVSTTQTETATTQSVEFLEVGTQLRLRPFISNDGMIRMEIHPELSTGTVRVEANFTLPDKEVTQVTTNIMTRDGATIVIGGLIRDELTNTTTQIPFLGSLPIVGPLFRHTSENNDRREILILITPHIVHFPETAYRGDKAAREFHHRHRVYEDQMSPLSKSYLGRKYFHAAQQAWHAGNRRKALRLINLSIHFDPRRRQSIDLRSDITSGVTQGDHTDVSPRRVGPLLHPLDGEVIAPWILNDLTSTRSKTERAIVNRAGSASDLRHAPATGKPGPARRLR